jgi:hypothetical protein
MRGGERSRLSDMSVVERECWHCDVCGFEWMKGKEVPKQCASSKCRSRQWNAGGQRATTARAVERETVRERVEPVKVEAPERPAARSDHDPATCRIYRCGMCAVAGKK